MIALISIIASLTIAIIGIAFLYRIALKDGNEEINKKRININTDYDGMGTFARYINKKP
ncbi:MAG: hypothetical protein LAT84_03455 [Balneolia bacterium]|nr:hypothetical protein [Balneolia bacterium]